MIDKEFNIQQLKEMAFVVQKITGQEIDIDQSPTNILHILYNYFDHLIAHMPGSVYWINKDGRYLGCNNGAAKLLGLSSRDEINGMTYENFAKKLGWNKNLAEIYWIDDQEVMKTGKPKLNIGTNPFLDANNQLVYQVTNKMPLFNKQGEVIGLVGISIDITDRKRAEEAEAKAEGMKLLAAAVAHEMRTPLATIDLCTDSIEEFLSELPRLIKNKNDFDLDTLIKKIQKKSVALVNIKHAVRVSFDFINTALSNLGYTSLKPTQFSNCSAIECVNEMIKEYPFNPPEDHVLINWYPNQDFIFRGLKPAFKRVLSNLLKNAIHYIKAANKGNIQIWLESEKEVNKLIFKDTGTGITEDVLPHIFEKFFTRTENGSGIGLAFCRYIMESFGGTITCNSKYGEFTQFTLTFPTLESHTKTEVGLSIKRE